MNKSRTFCLAQRCKALLQLSSFFLLFLSVIVLGIQPSKARDLLQNGKGLLWKVEGDVGAPSYLMGTMHSSHPQVSGLADIVAPLVERSSHLLVEVVDDAALRQTVSQSMALRNGQRLSQILPRETFDKIIAMTQRYGLSRDQMEGLKPWAASLMFSAPTSEFARLAAGQRNLDQRLQDIARRKGIALHSLEKLQEQLAFFEGLSLQDLQDFYRTIPSDMNQHEERFAVFVGYYLREDITGFYNYSKSNFGQGNEALEKRFLSETIFDRNLRMAKRSQPYLKEGGVFMAVGALHLPGAQGLVALLRAAGYRVSPLQVYEY